MSSTSSSWVWWLVGLLAAAAVVLFVVLGVRRQRARVARDAELAGVLAESTWLAHELLPAAFTAGSAAERREIWLASRPRVEALEMRINEVAVSGPSDRPGELGPLRDAVTDVRSAMDADAAAAVPADRESLGVARQAQRQLERALGAFRPQPDSGPGPAPAHG